MLKKNNSNDHARGIVGCSGFRLKRAIDSAKYGQFFLFILVGVINTIFGYSIFALLTFFGVHYVLAVFFATCLGVLFNFKTIGAVVFKSRNNKLLIRFIGVYVVQYVANIALIKLLLSLSINIYAAGAISTFVTAILSYNLNKYFVFARRR